MNAKKTYPEGTSNSQSRLTFSKQLHSRKRIFAWLILILLSSTICIIILELGSRILFDIRPANLDMLEPHPEAVYTLHPEFQGIRNWRTEIDGKKDISIQISAQGMRGPEINTNDYTKPRILFLGDSYTFGWALDWEDTFTQVTKNLIGDDYTIINAGVPGYGPWQERIFLNERCLPLAPDIVIFQGYISNDIDETLMRTEDHLDAYFIKRRESLLRHQFIDYWQVRLDNTLCRHSAFLNLLYLRVFDKQLMITRAMNSLHLFGQVPIPEFVPSTDRLWSYEPDLKEWYPKLEQGWDLMCDDILKIKEDCEKREIQFAAFAIPTTINIANDPSVSDDRYSPDKGTRLLEEFFAEEQIPFLPFRTLLRNHPDPDSLYFHGDGHINEAGAKLLGTALAEWVPRILKSAN